MESSRAVKVALVIGVVGAAGWLWRDDHLCRKEIEHRFGRGITIEHSFTLDLYELVPQSWVGIWHPGMKYPVAVSCWTNFSGVSGFKQR